MIDALEKDLSAAEAARKRLDETVNGYEVGAGRKYELERRFYDGYITGIKYAIVLAREKAGCPSRNPLLRKEKR